MYSEKYSDKEFKIDARGFRPQEVDKFLDMVIRDYTEYNNIIKKLEQDIRDLTEDNAKLKKEIRRLQEEVSTSANQSAAASRSVNNIDLLKRISNLEKIVYGNNE